jgi:hypothetical protein
MSKQGFVEIREAANGFIVQTNAFCFGDAQIKVFETWSGAQEFIRTALRIPAIDSTGGSAHE